MEDEAQPNPIVPTPQRLFGDFLGVQKVTRRPQAAKSPRKALNPLQLLNGLLDGLFR